MEAKFFIRFFDFGCIEGLFVLSDFFVEQVSELARILNRKRMENILREIN